MKTKFFLSCVCAFLMSLSSSAQDLNTFISKYEGIKGSKRKQVAELNLDTSLQKAIFESFAKASGNKQATDIKPTKGFEKIDLLIIPDNEQKHYADIQKDLAVFAKNTESTASDKGQMSYWTTENEVITVVYKEALKVTLLYSAKVKS